MKLYQDTEKELSFDDYKPLPSLREVSLTDLYELSENLESAIDNAYCAGSDLLVIALDMDYRKVNLYIRMKERRGKA